MPRSVACMVFILTSVGCGETPPSRSAKVDAAVQAPERPPTPPTPKVDPVVDAMRAASLQLAEAATLEVERFVADLPQNERVAETTKRLVYAASYTSSKRRTPWRAAQSKDYKALEKATALELAAADPKSPTLPPEVVERLKAAVKLTLSEDAYERSAAYEFVERTLQKRPEIDHRPYFISFVPPYEIAERGDERFQQVEALSLRPFARIIPFLWRAALDDEAFAVRAQAMAGLDRWIADHPDVGKPAIVRAINARWDDPITQGNLFELAGLMKVPEVLEWCRNSLDGQRNALACRVGLSRLGTPEAFDVLMAWVEKRSQDKRLLGPNHYGFREDFAHLAPYADQPHAKDRYYAFFDAVLGQVRRSGFATGMIARRSVFLKDAPRALEILRRHHATYVQLWTRVRITPERKFLLDEFPKAIAAFEARVPPPSDAKPQPK